MELPFEIKSVELKKIKKYYIPKRMFSDNELVKIISAIARDKSISIEDTNELCKRILDETCNKSKHKDILTLCQNRTRGSRKKISTKGTKNDEQIVDTVKANTVDTMLFFTNAGKMYRCVVDKIPACTNASKGTYIGDIVKFDAKEKIVAVSSLHRRSMPKYAVFFTKEGVEIPTNEYKLSTLSTCF